MVEWTQEYWTEQLVEKSLRIWNFFNLKPALTPIPQNLNRILICAYHGLGNFLLYTPTLRALREYFSDARIDLQVGNNTGCEEILAGSNYFTEVYNISSKASWKDWKLHTKKIQENKYDLVINEFHSNFQQLAMMVSFSKILYRVGHVRSPGWKDRYGFIYNLPVVMEEDQHEIDRYFALARKLSIPEKYLNPKTFIVLAESDRAWAKNFLQEQGINKDSILIGIQMGTSSNMRWKQWSPEKFKNLCEKLLLNYPQASLLFLGSPNELEMVKEFIVDSPRTIFLVGTTNIKQAAALIEKCNLLICNDSGLMHVAVAVNTPVAAIYGPTDYRRTAPLGEKNKIIRKDLPCSPCFKMNGASSVLTCPHHNCLNMIEVDEVFRTVENILGN